MAVEKMYLVNMISNLDNLDNFLEDVIKIGEIEPVDAFNQVTNRTFNIRASAENVDITEDINKLSGFQKEDDGYNEKLVELKNSLNLADSQSGNLVDPQRVNEFYDRLKSLIKEKEELEEKSRQLNIYKENVDKLRDYNIDIEKIQNLKFFDYRYGSVSEDGRFILKNNYENIPSLIIHLDNDVDRASLNAIEEIYALDEATYNLNDQTEKVLADERLNTRNVSLSLDQEYNKKTKEESDKIYNEIMDDANNKINSINADYQSKINFMDSIYKEYKGEVIDRIVDFLIEDKDFEM
ncbi:V-type ATP synthase subunit I domain-containing protein [Anaerococcus provencensis]|uniref:hypothetical protein n=1 Tax=Anaerococcus provencensis TaxID=938293 RepID=UPI00030C5334|nr:hypothetical protein [Anaerococcus provencensis]